MTITVFIPTEATVKALASVVGYVTDGLDAVLLAQSAVPGGVELRLAGNPRDTAIALDRAEHLGGELR